MNRTVDLTLDEDELHRLYIVLHAKLAELKKPGTPKVFEATAKRYEALFDKVCVAYKGFYSYGNPRATPYEEK